MTCSTAICAATRSPRTSTAHVSPELNPDHKTARLIEVCQELLPEWASVQVADIDVSLISGGISNTTFKFTPKNAALAPVVVKLFGDKTELLVNRKKERQSLVALNAVGFGAQVLGFYANGRIEAFLTAKTLQPDDISSPVYTPRIAQKLHALHQVRIKGWELADNLFTTIRSWLSTASRLTFADPAKQAQFSALDFDRMSAEIEEVAALCAATASPVVFAHGDLQSGNIMELLQGSCEAAAVPRPDAALQFIDFEYSDYCARGFDFGNYFNEYAGNDCDYSRYPSASLQKDFFRSYLAGSEEPADEAALDLLVAEANLYSLASHIYAGVWALVQARYSAIDFDYLAFSQLRWQQYYKTKEAFVAKAQEVFAGPGSSTGSCAGIDVQSVTPAATECSLGT